VITDEVYVEIELLRRHGLSLRRIAAEVGCANTVRAHLASPGLPRYVRKAKRVTKLAPFEAYLRKRQAAAQPHRGTRLRGHTHGRECINASAVNCFSGGAHHLKPPALPVIFDLRRRVTRTVTQNR